MESSERRLKDSAVDIEHYNIIWGMIFIVTVNGSDILVSAEI
jgi:hypothetical protein